MYSLYKKLVERRILGKPPRQIDPAVTFSRRDWADLPPHHPRTDRD